MPQGTTAVPHYDFVINVPLKNGASVGVPQSLGIHLDAFELRIQEHEGDSLKVISGALDSYLLLRGNNLVTGPCTADADKFVEIAERNPDYDRRYLNDAERYVLLTVLGKQLLESYRELLALQELKVVL